MPYIEEITAGSPIQPLPTSVTGFVGACSQGPVDTPVPVTSAAEYHALFGPTLDADRPLGHAVDLFFANGGASAAVVRAGESAPERLVPTGAGGGVHALDSAGVTVLAIPGLTTAHQPQVSVALTWCAAHRAVLLLDLPRGPWDAAAETAVQRTGPHRERAAAYHPWLVVGGVSVPPSGAVAGVIARSDAARGVWKPPANVGLHGVDGLSEALDDTAGQELNEEGVNALREFPGRGLRVWGARTLAGSRPGEPQHRYLHVRRLTDHVLASLAAGLGFVVFEPNEAPLWARVRMMADNFLNDLWRRGALQGTKSEQAYGVRCGLGDTMTPADVAAGRLVLSVFIATVKPAEFEAHLLTVQAQVPAGGPSRAEGPSLRSAGEPREWTRVTPRAVDLGRVVSRYIGETEKNLTRLLDAAQRTGEVLLFDEADALFGKRTEVRDSHDRFANQDVRRLIERLAKERDVEVRWRRRRRGPRRPGGEVGPDQG